MQYGPNPNAIHPNEGRKGICNIKNVITHPNIEIGQYTYFSDADGAKKFEKKHKQFIFQHYLWHGQANPVVYFYKLKFVLLL